MKKKDSPKSRSRRLTAVVTIIVVLAVLIGVGTTYVGYQLIQHRNANNVYPEVVLEAGANSVSARDFLKKPDNKEPLFLTDISQISLQEPGAHRVQLTWHNTVYERILRIQDTVAPTGTARDVTSIGKIPEPSEFVAESFDITPVTVSYKQLPDAAISGPQDVTILLTDTSGNILELDAVLTLIHDTTAPEFSGIRNPITVYTGDTISYRTDVTVSDDYDPDVKWEVDSSQVDLSKAGKYPVTYTATDAAGNTTAVEITVYVKERASDHGDPEVLKQKIDQVLSKILKDGMSVREQVTAIYNYVSTHFGYGDNENHTDVQAAALRMLDKGSGDCFNYFSVSKVMLERLEIPNIDVEKIKNYESDSRHYWSLVSVDGGKTYYHFDTTPRKGDGDYFCLVTDAQLDAYSATHYNSHNRDKSLYPATPEE